MTEHASEKMATIRGEVLLSGELGLYPKNKNLYKVSLTRSGIFYSLYSDTDYENEVKVVHLSDVIGCRCQRSPGCPSAFITIFSYPFKKKMFSSKSSRKRVPVIFEVKISASFDANLKLAERWRNVINCLSRSIPFSVEDLDNCCPPAPGRLLILINPHSGPGKALQIFNNEVKPMIEEAEIPYKMQVTEYAGHARDMLQSLELSEWYGVVIVSGDGLIYEVINGLMERPDWEDAIRLPVGCLPGGSGNALCCSINYSAGEPIDLNAVLHSTFILIKHNVVPMDLVLVQSPTQRIFSFLSVCWGIMADVDLESEKYRSIGEARFTLGALKRILSLRSYKGRVSFLPVAEYEPRVVNGVQKDNVLTKIRRFSLRSRSNSKSTLSSGSNDQLSVFGSQDLLNEAINAVSSNPDLSQEHSSIPSVNGEFQNGESQEHSRLSHSQSANISHMEVRGKFSHNNANLVENTQRTSDTEVSVAVTNGHVDDEGEILSIAQREAAIKQKSQNTTSNNNFFDNAQGTFDKMDGAARNGNSEARSSTSSQNASAAKQEHLKWKKSTITASGSRGDIEIDTETASARRCENHYLSSPLLPPLDQPVPEDWVVLEDNFISLTLQYQTHLNTDVLAAPYAHFCDGFMYLMIIRDGISRNALLNLFLSLAEGSHIDSPHVEMIKVLAFRIEPSATEGIMMVDGEKIDFGPIQGQILPKLSRIMAIK